VNVRLIDDKLRILHAVKKVWGARVTAVFPRQGHYAFDPAEVAKYPQADVTIEQIGDLCRVGARIDRGGVSLPVSRIRRCGWRLACRAVSSG
jgi:hypothetical protein